MVRCISLLHDLARLFGLHVFCDLRTLSFSNSSLIFIDDSLGWWYDGVIISDDCFNTFVGKGSISQVFNFICFYEVYIYLPNSWYGNMESKGYGPPVAHLLGPAQKFWLDRYIKRLLGTATWDLHLYIEIDIDNLSRLRLKNNTLHIDSIEKNLHRSLNDFLRHTRVTWGPKQFYSIVLHRACITHSGMLNGGLDDNKS